MLRRKSLVRDLHFLTREALMASGKPLACVRALALEARQVKVEYIGE